MSLVFGENARNYPQFMEDEAVQNTPLNLEEAPYYSKHLTDVTRMQHEGAFYAAMLEGQDPVGNYQKAIAEYQLQGESEFVKNIQTIVDQEEDMQKRQILGSLIADPQVSREDKKKYLVDYANTKIVPTSLRDKYAEKIAIQADPGMDENTFLRTFFEKEIYAAKTQEEINRYAATFDTDTTKSLVDLVASVFPITGALRDTLRRKDIEEAITNEEVSTLQAVKDYFLFGSNIKRIQDRIKELSPQEQYEASKRALEAIRKFSGPDFNRYQHLLDTLEGDLSKTEQVLYDSLGVLAGLIGGGTLVKKVLGAADIGLRVGPKTQIGTTLLHNPEVGGKLAAASLVDESGKAAQALGEEKAKIMYETLLPKASDGGLSGLSPDIRRELEDIDQQGKTAIEIAQENTLLYTPEVRQGVAKKISKTMQGINGLVYHQNKSSILDTDSALTGVATYGRTEKTAFDWFEHAEKAAKRLKKQVPEGSISIVKVDTATGNLIPAIKGADDVPGQYFIQWKFAHKYNPLDALAFGENAVKMTINVPFLNREYDITRFAAPLLFPAVDKMPRWVAQGAMVSFDQALAIERPFLAYAKSAFAPLSREQKAEVAAIIDEGASQAKIFTGTELKTRLLAKGFEPSKAEEVIRAYAITRRANDWMYALANKATKSSYQQQGMKAIKIGDETIYAKPVDVSEILDIRAFYDPVSKSIQKISAGDIQKWYKANGTFVRLGSRVHMGKDIVQYAKLPLRASLEDLPEFVLPYIKGYAPRYYKEYWMVKGTEEGTTLNGMALSKDSKEALATYGAAKTKQEATQLIGKLKEEYPDVFFDVFRERSFENNLLEDINLYKQTLMHSKKRGNLLAALGREPELEDPALALYRTIQGVSKYAVLSEFNDFFQRSFVKQYGKLTEGVFPSNIGEINVIGPASAAASKQLQDAQQMYKYYETLNQVRVRDEEWFQRVVLNVSEALEGKAPKIAEFLRENGMKAYPPHLISKVVRTLFISGNPLRQVILQPSQLIPLASLDPKYVLTGRMVPDIWGLLVGAGLRNNPKFNIPTEVLDSIVSKTMRISPEEYANLVDEFRKSGLFSSVDTHLLVEGMFNQGSRKLLEGRGEALAASVQGAITAVPKALKSAGFDLGERINLAGHWMIARRRQLSLNPEADTNSKSFNQLVAANARELSGTFNRAGEMPIQRGILAVPLQFAAVPMKIASTFLTGKLLTPAEKTRLAATYIGVYGAAGVGLTSLVDKLREGYGDSVPAPVWTAVRGGTLNLAFNALISAVIDGESEIDFSSSISPFAEGMTGYGNIFETLNDGKAGELLLGPGWNLFNFENGRLPQTYRDIAVLWKREDIGADKYPKMLWEAAELASGGTNFTKAYLLYRSGIVAAATGQSTGLEAHRSAAIAKLFGFKLQGEEELRRLQEKVYGKGTKGYSSEVDRMATYLYNSAMQLAQKHGGPEQEQWQFHQNLLTSYLSYTDDDMYNQLLDRFSKLDRKALKDQKTSVQMEMYRKAWMKSEEERKALSNYMRSSPSPQIQQLREDLNTMFNAEVY